MAFNRDTAIFKARPRNDWGGTYMNSNTWNHMFRGYKEHDFGVMEAQAFASRLGSHQINKPWYFLTEAQNNVMELPAATSHYTWALTNDSHTRISIVDVDSNLGTQPGKGGELFYIYLNRGWYHEPTILKTESHDGPMIKIVGDPDFIRQDVYRYTCKIQSSNPLAYIDPSFLQTNRTLIDATTQVADELNTKFGGIETGAHHNLSGFIGYVARKIEVTDKFIRHEIRCRKEGKANDLSYSFNGQRHTSAISTGYTIVKRNKGKMTKDEIMKSGYAITTAEALLSERIAMDKEMLMTFAHTEVAVDRDTKNPITYGAGWHSMAKDGNYSEHQLDFTLDTLTSRLDATQYNTVEPESRKLCIKAGEVGIAYLSRLINTEAGLSPFILNDQQGGIMTVKSADYNKFGNEVVYENPQFTGFRGFNGLMYYIMHDPTKDNPLFYPDIDPDTGKPFESASLDIINLGENSDAHRKARTKSNVCMVKEPAYESYFTTEGVYNLETGAVNDGSNVRNLNKEAGIYRESSAKLEIWDIGQTFRWASVA